MTEPDNEFLGDLVHGVSTRRQELDGLIAQALSGERTVDRLETLLRVILRGGAYELSSKPDVPAAVVITEYLDVAHAFFDDKGVGLVNGVLDRLAYNLRAGEF
jgi:N utilization substance protein B